MAECPECGESPDERGYDACLVELIDVLNKHGLVTVEHCCGHGMEGRKSIGLSLEESNMHVITLRQGNGTVVWLEWEAK